MYFCLTYIFNFYSFAFTTYPNVSNNSKESQINKLIYWLSEKKNINETVTSVLSLSNNYEETISSLIHSNYLLTYLIHSLPPFPFVQSYLTKRILRYHNKDYNFGHFKKPLHTFSLLTPNTTKKSQYCNKLLKRHIAPFCYFLFITPYLLV